MDFFATAAKGTEPALRDELRELRIRGVRADRGGVHFTGDFAEGWRACLWSRVAVRVHVKLAEVDARHGDALYDGVRTIDWGRFVTPRHTLAVRAASRGSALAHTQFIAQRTKDAIVDPIRERLGARPSVNLDDPDVLVFVHVSRDRATIYLDLGGDSLHRRGYRTRIREAPLKETLAAAMLRLSGWDRVRPLVDPMCGSGTIALEATLWARNVAPGLARPRFGFERWAVFDDGMARDWRAMREHARAAVRSEGPDVVASDIDPEAIVTAQANARDAGATLTFVERRVRDLPGFHPPGIVVTNPPYGERLAGAHDLYREMADAFRGLTGHRVAIIAGTPEIGNAIRLHPAKWYALMNGAIECRFLIYDIP